jgi:hypothetical protein
MPRLTSAEQIELSYDLAMTALADYLTQQRDPVATVDTLIRLLDRDSLREAITEVLVDSRVHSRPESDVPAREQEPPHDRGSTTRVRI